MTQSWPQTSCVHVALASLPMSDAIARHQNRLPRLGCILQGGR